MQGTYLAFCIVSADHLRRVNCVWWPWEDGLDQRCHVPGPQPGFLGEHVRFCDLLDSCHDQNVSNAFEKRCFGWLFPTEIYYRSTDPSTC